MAALLGHDIDYTLWVQCDLCGDQMMAFGQNADGRPELEAKIRGEGWRHLGGDGWLCENCAANARGRTRRTYPATAQRFW